jgi:Ca2+-binding RTX toxin-like protein
MSDSVNGANRDVITDFLEGDKIDLSAVGATTFINGDAFRGRAGEVRAVQLTDQTIIEFDKDGDGRSDFQIELTGSINLDRLDFVGLSGAATSQNDELFGTDGNDSIDGLAGNDTIYGFGGIDTLTGGAGNDVLIGGAGRDTLIGGAGADRFVYDSRMDSPSGAGRDAILDFQRGSDKIDISGVGDFTFIGSRAFNGIGDQVRVVSRSGTTFVEADTDGDRIADFQIELVGNVPLAASDFIF